jgi:hypothetical protein
MKAWERQACLAVAAIALLATPAAASAKRGYFVQPRGVSVGMTMRGSHGYKVTVRTIGNRFVLLSATKGSVSAEYAVVGRINRHGIWANFGDLGRIAVRFHGSKAPRKRNPLSIFKCKGKRTIREVGAFRGTIEFRGELGFTSISARHVRGAVRREFRRVCHLALRPRPEPRADLLRLRERPGSLELTTVAAALRSAGRAVLLEGIHGEIPGKRGRRGISLTLVLANLQERHDKVFVSRSAFIVGDDGSIIASQPGERPETATVQLPRPFGGSASYSKEAGAAASWTGTLSAWLPGAGPVPLTGPDFVAALCRGGDEKKLKRCLADVQRELGPGGVPLARPQGNGSHSQPFADARLSWSR